MANEKSLANSSNLFSTQCNKQISRVNAKKIKMIKWRHINTIMMASV